MNCLFRKSLGVSIALILSCAVLTGVQARVSRIVIDEVKALPADQSGGVATEQSAGRAFGELDPQAAANRIINDKIPVDKAVDEMIARIKQVAG